LESDGKPPLFVVNDVKPQAGNMRPFYHQTHTRVQAHNFVATLAHLLHRGIEKKLKAAHTEISPPKRWRANPSARWISISAGYH
jgi:hypothetical protein